MKFDTDLRDGTRVTFAGDSLAEKATVGFVGHQDGQWIAVTDRTPFHPSSLSWPDQPGDIGWLTLADGHRVAVLDTCEGCLDCATGVLFTGDDALIQRRTDPELRSVVLHVMDGHAVPALHVGQSAKLEIDATHRSALSLQHTGVHLSALALNQCTAAFWTKDYPEQDSLGFPNFDKSAVTRSQISLTAATDVYRLGKSLRKKGFDRDAFLSDLKARGLAVNDCLRRMLATPAPVRIAPGEGYLDARRVWSTVVLNVDVSIPCGGTHVPNLAVIADVTVELAEVDDGFVMVTTSRAVDTL